MTPQEYKAAILAQPDGSPIRVAYAAGNDVRTAELLRELTEQQQRVPAMESAFQLAPLMQPASVAAVFNHPRFSDFRETFNSGNRVGTIEWATVFRDTGIITAGDRTAILNYLMTPIPTTVPKYPNVTAGDVYLTRAI